MKTSCKDCTRRHIGCHSSCEDYRRFAEENEKRKASLEESPADNYRREKALKQKEAGVKKRSRLRNAK